MPRSSRYSRRDHRRLEFDCVEPRRLLSVYLSQVSNPPPDYPFAITSGPGGDLYFVNEAYSIVGSSASVITQVGFVDPITHTSDQVSVSPERSVLDTPQPQEPAGITTGPDGNVWFTDINWPDVGYVVPGSRAFAEFAVQAGDSVPAGIAAGSDGNLWFTLPGTNSLGSISPTTHAITYYPLPTANSNPLGITAGPDGNLWFVEQGIGMIGEINPTTHAISQYPAPTPGNMQQITAAPDGNLWFGEGSRIGEINPTTHATADYPANVNYGVGVGPDGNVWFDDIAGNSLGMINLSSHVVTEYPLPGLQGQIPTGIATASDGTVWANDSGLFDVATVVPDDQGWVQSSVTGPGGTPIVGAIVYLDLNNSGTFSPSDPSAATNAAGNFTLKWPTAGTYTLRLATYPGDIVTSSNGGAESVTISDGTLTTAPGFTVVQTSVVLPLTYNPSPFGTNNPDLATAEVTGLYNLILGHAPDPTGLAAWVSALNSGTPLSTLSTTLLNSPEYETLLILSYYKNFLNTTPTVGAVNEWVGFMQAGMSVNQVVTNFLNTPEYNALHPSDDSFIESLYANFFGRSAASWELSAWDTALASGTTRLDAILSFVNNSATNERELDGLYAEFLARPPDSAGLTFWTAALQAGTPLISVAADFGSSPDFVSRANATVS